MILAELKSYLQQREWVCLSDMATHFQIAPDALRGMLELWIRKGHVSRREGAVSCRSRCSGCDSGQLEWYAWRNSR